MTPHRQRRLAEPRVRDDAAAGRAAEGTSDPGRTLLVAVGGGSGDGGGVTSAASAAWVAPAATGGASDGRASDAMGSFFSAPSSARPIRAAGAGGAFAGTTLADSRPDPLASLRACASRACSISNWAMNSRARGTREPSGLAAR